MYCCELEPAECLGQREGFGIWGLGFERGCSTDSISLEGFSALGFRALEIFIRLLEVAIDGL